MEVRSYPESSVVVSFHPRHICVYDARRGELLGEFRPRSGDPSFSLPLAVQSSSGFSVASPRGRRGARGPGEDRVLELEGAPRLDPRDGEGVALAGLGFEPFAPSSAGKGSVSARAGSAGRTGASSGLAVALLPEALCVHDPEDPGALAVYSMRTCARLCEVSGLRSRPVAVFSLGRGYTARLATDELVFLRWEGWQTSAQLLLSGGAAAPAEGVPSRVRVAIESIRAGEGERRADWSGGFSTGPTPYQSITVPRWVSPAPFQLSSQKVESLPADGPVLAHSPEEMMSALLRGYERNDGGAIRTSLERISAVLPRFTQGQLETLSLLLEAYPQPPLRGFPPSLLAGLGAEDGPLSSGPARAGLSRALERAGVQDVPVSDRPYDQLLLSI